MPRDNIRLWRDQALGVAGVELLAGRCFEHRYEPHFHDEVVIAAFVDGAQRHRVGRHHGVATSGCVLIIPPGETHTGQAEQEAGWSYRAFYPDKETLWALAADLFGEARGRSLSFGVAPLHDDPVLARKLVALHRIAEAAKDEPLARQQAFATAMLWVLLRYSELLGAPATVEPEVTAIRRAIDFANCGFGNPTLGIAELAGAAGLSAYHFMRSFRKATGMTAHSFVTQLRVVEARRLLAAGEPAAQVALAVGFADQSHLIRRFRAALGITPGQYATETKKRATQP